MLSLLLATVLFLAGTAGMAQDPRDVAILPVLERGHWVEVRGRLDDSGRFLAERIELRSPRRETLWGVAEEGVRPATIVVLGRTIDLRGTRYEQRSSELLGHRVRLRGVRGAGHWFVVHSLDVRAAGVERIEGRVDGVEEHPDGRWTLRLLDFDVSVPPDVKQRLGAPLDALVRIPPRAVRSAFSANVDPDDLFGEGFALGSAVHLGIQQEALSLSRRNTALDSDDDFDEEDREDTSHNLRARVTWIPSSRVLALLDVRHRYRWRDHPESGTDTDSRSRLGEAFLLFRDLGPGLDLQIGRQDFDEPREWIYDQNLDGVRLFTQTRRLSFELSMSTTLDGGTQRDRDATNTIVYVSNRSSRRHLAAYVVNRAFGAVRGERRTHFGVRALGSQRSAFRPWLDVAFLSGYRADRDVEAWGIDTGFTLRTPGPRRLTLVVGWARGGGDDGSRVDRRFRQTGLQDNDARLAGVTSIRYYGELFDPELSNMEIATLGLGVRFMRRSSLEIVAHRYAQVVPSRRLTNTTLDRRPNGINDDLGDELDFVVGIRRFENWDIELVHARFREGAAFQAVDDATLTKVQIRYRY